MKVLNIIEESRFGGPQNRILQVASKLFSHSIYTTVLTNEAGSYIFVSKLSSLNIDHVLLPLSKPSIKALGILKFFFFLIPDVLRIISVIKKNKFSLIHASGGIWQVKALFASRICSMPIVLHINDTNMPSFLLFLFKFFVPKPDHIIFASHASHDYYLRLFQNIPFTIVPAPVDSDFFSYNFSYIGSSPPIFVSAGSVVPTKGFHVLIKSFAVVQSLYPNALLVIVGPTRTNHIDYYHSLTNLVSSLGLSKNVSFVGSSNDVRYFLYSSHVYVCSSLSESSPLSVWEAMSAGIPLVSTSVGDVPRYITHNYSGWLAKPNDISDLSSSMLMSISDDSSRKLFSLRARSVAEKYLDTNIIASLTNGVYRKL